MYAYLFVNYFLELFVFEIPRCCNGLFRARKLESLLHGILVNLQYVETSVSILIDHWKIEHCLQCRDSPFDL